MNKPTAPIELTDQLLQDVQANYPQGGLTWTLASEVVRLRAQVEELLPLFEDIVIGERIRERAANDNGHRTPLGEVAADFGIDFTLDEMQEARRG